MPEAAAPEPMGTGYEAADIRRVWTQLLQAVAERNRPTQALLLNAKVQELRDFTLVLSMPTSGLTRQFAQQHRIEFVRDALRSLLGDGEWDVRCVEEGAQPHSTAKQQSPAKQNQSAAPQAEKSRRPSAGWASSDGKSGSAPSGNGSAGDSGNSSPHGSASGRAAQPTQSAAAPSEKPQRARSADDDIPPPPEPPDEEPPPDEPVSRAAAPAPASADEDEDEESMIVHSTHAGTDSSPARDNHDEAVELFASELGARTLDN